MCAIVGIEGQRFWDARPSGNAWDTRCTGYSIRDAGGNTRDTGRNMRYVGCDGNIRGARWCCGNIGRDARYCARGARCRDATCISSSSCRMI